MQSSEPTLQKYRLRGVIGHDIRKPFAPACNQAGHKMVPIQTIGCSSCLRPQCPVLPLANCPLQNDDGASLSVVDGAV